MALCGGKLGHGRDPPREKLTILSGYDIQFMHGYIADKEGMFKERKAWTSP